MADGEIVSGQLYAWCLNHKLGEGDAGEVYLVESLVGGRSGILKRPARSAFSGDVFRQTAQIRIEARVLNALSSALVQDPGLGLAVPEVLDQSKPGASYNERNFIVIEKAHGLDLSALGRISQLGLLELDSLEDGPGTFERVLLESIATTQKIPELILIKILSRLLSLLELSHTLRISDEGSEVWGIVWNDVKPDHLFWDPVKEILTVIDWGNARFLESDRTTNDRKFSWADDYRQLFEEFGRFLDLVAPLLSTRLDWPGKFSLENSSPESLESLRDRLTGVLIEENRALAEVRAEETDLLQSGLEDESLFARLEEVQKRILAFGELPDFAGAQRFARGYATRLVQQDRLDEIRHLCDWTVPLPKSNPDQWRLVCDLARIPGRSQGEQRQAFLAALQAAIGENWDGVVWNLAKAIQGYPEPDWWSDLTGRLRHLALGAEADTVRPLVAMRRFGMALQSLARRIEDHHQPGSHPDLERLQSLTRRVKEEILPAWTALDPDPPDCGLSYATVESLLHEAADLLPEEQRALLAQLSQPRQAVKQVLDAWDRNDMLLTLQGLERLLLWDPDRWRVLHARQAILSAPEYCKKVYLGPQSAEKFPPWLTDLEFQGRQLRNRVGPAAWLDDILDSCKQIRKGAWPADLMRAIPTRLAEMPWLSRFERLERLPTQTAEAQEGQSLPLAAATDFHGVVESWLGAEGAIALLSPLDAWMPEARGSSARVALGQLVCQDGQRREAAVKLMRMDQVHYALPLFKEEVRVLTRMDGIPGVARLLECGFLQLEEGAELPLDANRPQPPPAGRVVRIGQDASAEFLDQVEARSGSGWIPYLAIEKQRQEDSLLLLCDSGLNRGQYQPVVTLLQMGIQICEILQIAHERNIVYRDHKILHYYWKAEANGLYIIDWNVARYHPDGLTATDIEMDLVQFGARGLHHIMTGRTAPGALPLGPTRPEEIEQAASTYQTQWTYDDQRLSGAVRSVLERVLAGEFKTARELGDGLKRALMQLS